MRLPGLPVSVRLTDVPDAVDGGGPLPVAFRVRTKQGGLLTCEVSLWCALVNPVGGLRWPPESQLSAEVVKVALDPAVVGPGGHDREVELAVPPEVRPTLSTKVGKVRYELNVVAVVDGHQGVANRDIVVRSTDPNPWIDADEHGDGPWSIVVEVGTGRPGGDVAGTVIVDAGEATDAVTVSARLECFEEAAGEQASRWHQERTLEDALALRPGAPVTLPVRFELPKDAVPTVVTRTFAERWLLTVRVSDGRRERQRATGVAVLS